MKASKKREKDIEQALHPLHKEHRRNGKGAEEAAAAQQKYTTLWEQLKEASAQVDVVTRENDLFTSLIGDFEAETARLIKHLKQVKSKMFALKANPRRIRLSVLLQWNLFTEMCKW